MMMPNSYNSFEEINNQLKILSLQKQINKQHIKLNFKNSKTIFNVTNLKNEFKRAFQEQLFSYVVNNLLKRFR
jgi:hypothetical protein